MSAERPPEGSGRISHNCAGVRRDGSPCTTAVLGSHKYCYHHDPELEEQRRERAINAAKAKGKPPRIVQVQDEIRDTINQVKRGELQTNKAQVMFTGFGVLVRAIEQERKQREIEELAEVVEELQEQLTQRNREGFRVR